MQVNEDQVITTKEKFDSLVNFKKEMTKEFVQLQYLYLHNYVWETNTKSWGDNHFYLHGTEMIKKIKEMDRIEVTACQETVKELSDKVNKLERDNIDLKFKLENKKRFFFF